MTHAATAVLRRIAVSLPLALLTLFAAACNYDSAGGGNSGAFTAPRPTAMAHLGVSPDFVTLPVGAFAQLSVTLVDVNGKIVDDPGVVWTTSDDTVVSVNEQGLVLAMSPGETIVTATVGPDMTASAKVLVLAPAAQRR